MVSGLAWGSGGDCALVGQLNDAFVLGNQRTATQDVEFSFHQLVEIAMRALSPGINDPFTAIACVDRLGIGPLCQSRPMRYAIIAAIRSAHGRLRLVTPVHVCRLSTRPSTRSGKAPGRIWP
ncbi:MAG: DUF2254 domain-containing protein [Comamonadaceae bacterium]|nr:DUF2254 domain-containing protein [Comamonadaceae bacterium]